MTRRVLVSNRLPELQSGDPVIDAWVREHLQRHIAEIFEQISFLTPEEGSWTAAVRGSGTAGTYEIDSQLSRYYRIADLVVLWFHIVLDTPLTGGGAGDLQITGAPFQKMDDVNAVGTAHMSGVDWTAAANHVLGFVSTDESSTLGIFEINDNAVATALAIGSLAAGDLLIGSIAYQTNGVRTQ